MYKSMKNLMPWLAFGTCVCLTISWLVIFHFQNNGTAQPQAPAFQMETQGVDSSPVSVPEPSPRAVSFHHSTMRLIAVGFLWNLFIPVVFLFTGFSAKLQSWAEKVGRRWYFSYAIYFTGFSLAYFLLLTPLVFYGQFIHLHHYGLSNQSFVRWLSSFAKIAASVLLIGLAVGWIPFFVIKKSPRRWWLYLGLLAPLYLCFTFWIRPVLIDPLYHRFTPLQDQALERKLLAEAARAGIQGGLVYQVDMSRDTKTHNAYVAGFMGTKRIVFYDTMLQSMNEDELLFIMAHEMGHYVLWHRGKRLMLESILILLSLYVAFLLAGPVLRRFENTWRVAAPSDFAALPLLGVLAFLLFCIVLRPIEMAFRRHNELEADRFGLELTRKNHAAATAFAKLSQLDLSIPRPGTISEMWFGSHPCFADRIEFCNTYKPWETGQPSKYEEYMKL